MPESRPKLFAGILLFACALVVFAAYEANFSAPPQPVRKASRPREVCYGGIVYLEFGNGGVFAKINRAGNPVGCL